MASSFSKICTAFRAPALSQSSILAPRLAALGRHDPSLKRKKTHKIDKKKKQKKSSNISKKPIEIFPPVDPEAFIDRNLLQKERVRNVVEVDEQEQERRILLLKEYSKYRNQQQRDELRKLQEVVMSRELALRELKKVSPWHYEEAVKTDDTLFPLHMKGPSETPPIVGYIAPDIIDEK